MPQNINEAVEAIKNAKTKAFDHLASLPNLQMQTDHTLQRLINALCHAGGLPVGEETTDREAPKALTHIAGRKLGKTPPKKNKQEEESQPKSRLSAALEKAVTIQNAYDDIARIPGEMTPEQVLSKHTDFAIRAAMASTGLYVTPTEPENITKLLLEETAARIADLKELEEAHRLVEEASQTALNVTSAAGNPDLENKNPPPPSEAEAQQIHLQALEAANKAVEEAQEEFDAATLAQSKLHANTGAEKRNAAAERVNAAQLALGNAKRIVNELNPSVTE